MPWVVSLWALVTQMIGVIAFEAGTTRVHLGSRVLVYGLSLGLVSPWREAISALGAKVPIPIARSANSAWHVGWVMIVAGRAFGKRPGVRLSGRLHVLDHGMLGSWRRVLRCNHRVILV